MKSLRLQPSQTMTESYVILITFLSVWIRLATQSFHYYCFAHSIGSVKVLIMDFLHSYSSGSDLKMSKLLCIERLKNYYLFNFQETITRLRSQTDNYENYVFSMYLQDGDVLIGNSKLEMTEQMNCYEIGYWLHHKHCGSGLTTECVKRLIRFAREELKATKLCMYVADENVACQRVATKTGFQFVQFVDLISERRPDWGNRKNCYLELVL